MLNILRNKCNNHHYEDYKPTGAVRLTPDIHGTKYYLDFQESSGCLHHGCSKTRKRWRIMGEVKVDSPEEFIEQLKNNIEIEEQ